MCLISTGEAAEAMLKSGGYFTAATLGVKLEITAKEASGLLYNIRVGKKYETLETELPNRTVKVLSILGRKVNKSDLWRLVLGLGAASALGRQKSSKLFTCYRETSPNNMVHDLNKRKYVIGSGFKSVYLGDKCPKEYLKSTTIVFN